MIRNKIMQMRRYIKHNPQKYLSNTPGVCRLLPPNHLIRTENLFLFLFSRWDVVCLCIHWVAVQNIKQHPFLVHVDGVYTIFSLFSFLFKQFAYYFECLSFIL
jgi:hypothetical protein